MKKVLCVEGTQEIELGRETFVVGYKAEAHITLHSDEDAECDLRDIVVTTITSSTGIVTPKGVSPRLWTQLHAILILSSSKIEERAWELLHDGPGG